MNARKLIAAGLAILMLFAFAACGGNNSPSSAGPNGPNDPNDPNNPNNGTATIRRYDRTRDITLGIWWDVVGSEKKEPDPAAANPVTEQMWLDNIRAIEDKYNVTFHYVNMTWDGVRESINTSIKAGTPDADIYQIELSWAIPILRSGYAMPISSFTSPDSDIHTEQKVMTKMNIADMPEDYLFAPVALVDIIYNTYMLGFNWDMLQEYGLENPQDVYDRGEWDWDTWMSYMKTCTDPAKNRYGFGCEYINFLSNMLLSNNASIAMGEEQTITSANTLAVLNFVQDMYNISNVAKLVDYDDWWGANDWSTGEVAFFEITPWLCDNNGITRLGYVEGGLTACSYDIRCVPWPIGPNAKAEGGVNATYNAAGGWQFIPKNTPDPDIVYDVYFELRNWWKDDVSYRDDLGAIEDRYVDERSMEYSIYVASNPQYDMWASLGISDEDGNNFHPGTIADGTMTAAQYAEHWKQPVQDALNSAFGK